MTARLLYRLSWARWLPFSWRMAALDRVMRSRAEPRPTRRRRAF